MIHSVFVRNFEFMFPLPPPPPPMQCWKQMEMKIDEFTSAACALQSTKVAKGEGSGPLALTMA